MSHLSLKRLLGGRKPKAFFLLAPGVIPLFVWMIVPLSMTIYYATQRYNLLNPLRRGYVGIHNFQSLVSDPAFVRVLINTVVLVGSVLIITVVIGLLLALIFDRDFPGKHIASTLAISPFFIMPVAGALIWSNMFLHPLYGLFAYFQRVLGMAPTDWLAHYPMLSVVAIVSWMWTPFAMLVILTGLKTLPNEVVEAVKLDGAGVWAELIYVKLPHLYTTLVAVIMLETIFFLAIFAKIFTSTGGGPGMATTTLPYLIYWKGFLEWNIGGASAGALVAVLLANAIAIFLLRVVVRNLTKQEAGA